MNGEVGRNAEFQGGAYAAKLPEFHSMQQGAGGMYKFRSVLDNIQPSGNGASLADRSRMYRGGKLPSLNGRSTGTDEKAQWLDSPYRTFG